ncbi:universal stress protein [Natronolimnohabitans innermongolicus]|uniref:UspA domain-containing protein n=1 Tax=Natronolimnohabitans innermongolicus JCM 12255 TaxID=1227499 RepID=L9XKG1_9EURY|nr:universal stress protein [Natronolimnohabitans innermongolicus]ELY62225.1 UspA domain-containing protein [Natronolimnohabitans innermongolicus JCM 12255]
MKSVYATELSAASEVAIETETCLDCLERIGVDELHLVTVVPVNVHGGTIGIDHEKRRRRVLRRYRNSIEDVGFDVETHVVRGTPHRRINGIAETVGADLSIVGSRGKSPLENRLIGSTTRNLARTTVVPLLVNRIERETESPDLVEKHLFERLLYATDFSANADRAFEAFSYLRHAAQEATLVHVETETSPGPDGDRAPEERLEELTDRLEEWDIDATIDVRMGDPADEILAAEATHEPTTTLVGSRGQSKFRRLLLGSVSESVVANAAGNVFLVPARRTA